MEKTIEQIRKEYGEKSVDKVAELRALDKKVRQPAEINAFTVGIVAALILGTGMSLCLGAIGSGTPLFIVGIVVGVLGLGLAVANYFIYRAFLKTRKNKYGPEILGIADELLNSRN